MQAPRFLNTGDTSLCVEFGNEISTEINQRIRALDLVLNNGKLKGIVETVPTYRSIIIHYDPEVLSLNKLKSFVSKAVEGEGGAEMPPAPVLEIPVLYGGEYGPDIKNVAENAGISEEEVIKIHTSKDYLIYMLGFLPGFTYLGGMDEKIATPRLKEPRLKITPGSVGIAGGQTGIYPVESPGGWQLIGRTPVKMYDPERETPILPEAGQYMHFFPIDEAEFKRIEALVAEGKYEVKLRTHEEEKA